MDTFKVVIEGQEYETQASSEEEATKKILNHLKKINQLIQRISKIRQKKTIN